jgi:hypothetical protein
MFLRYIPLSLPFGLLVIGTARTATAQPSSQDTAVASRLFDDAAKLMASDRAPEACPKYAESQRLDPQLGTLLHLAECYAKVGKTASAWASFKDAAELADQRNDPREAKIRERVASIEKTLSSVVVMVAPSEPADLEVRQDGQIVGRAAWGSPLPADPGTHDVTATASGRKPWRATVQVTADGATVHVNIPILEAAPAPFAVAPAPQANAMRVTSASSQPPAPKADASSSAGSTQRLLGWTTVGAGVVGLTVGFVFELQRSAKLSDRDGVCPTRRDCTTDDQARVDSLTSDARSASTVGLVGFVAGGVLTAGGLALVFTAPTGSPSNSVAILPVAARGFEGVAVTGRLW